jgi:hypothetical protein
MNLAIAKGRINPSKRHIVSRVQAVEATPMPDTYLSGERAGRSIAISNRRLD